MISKEYIGILAVAFSALLGVIGYLYKVWSDRVKSRKLVLFHLLEIHYVLKILPHSMSGLGSQYLSHCEELFSQMGIPVGNKAREELQKFLPAMQKYFDDLFSAIPKTLDDDFKRSFESALVSLAKDNPVLAYKLKNRQCLEMAGHAVQSYTDQLETLIVHPNNDNVGKVVKEEIDKSIEDAHAEILNEIDRDIKRVALGCGPVSYFKCWRVLKKKIEGESNFSEFELKEQFDLFLAKIVEEVGKKEKITAASLSCEVDR